MNRADELKKHLVEQYNFLNKSCIDFDNGDLSEAKRIATTLRIFIHHNPKTRSFSLLNQLEEEFGISVQIFTRGTHPSPNTIFYVGGPMLKQTNANLEYAPMMDLNYPNLEEISIDDWWQRVVLIANGVIFTRRDVMMSLADQDGGAHIDKKLNENYRKLTRENLINLQDQNGDNLENIHLVMARENAFYLLHGLQKNFSNIVSFK